MSKYYVDQRILEPPKKLQYIVTVNCIFKKDILKQIGVFDVSFKFAGGEDTELSLRLRKNGYLFAFEPDAVVLHDFSANFIDFCKMWIRYGRGTKRAIMKNR